MTVELATGDARAVLAGRPEGSVHMCVTSPPYWGLRKYAGAQDVEWSDGTTHALGLEPTPELYIAHLVECFAAVKRVLRDDGCLFVNIGDKSAGSAPRKNTGFNERWGNSPGAKSQEKGRDVVAQTVPGLKAKDCIGIPWMLAFALRADGWYWRDTIPWVKGASFCPGWSGSVMPESVRDRCTKAWEPILLFSKSARYTWD